MAKNYNNNHVIALQNRGVGENDGVVSLTFYGHASFMLRSPGGVTMVLDPWKNDESGFWGLWYHRKFPKTKCDIGLSTHNHFDHNAIERLECSMVLDRMAGTFSLADVSIEGYADKHTTRGSTGTLFDELGIEKNPPNNIAVLDNTMFVITTGGIRFLFWGDNRFDAPDDVLRAIGEVDVLIIPVDDSMHLLTFEEVSSIACTTGARAIVPCHYLTEKVGSTLSTLKTADLWVNQHQELVESVGTHTKELTLDSITQWPRATNEKICKTLYFAHFLPFDPSQLPLSTLRES